MVIEQGMSLITLHLFLVKNVFGVHLHAKDGLCLCRLSEGILVIRRKMKVFSSFNRKTRECAFGAR